MSIEKKWVIWTQKDEVGNKREWTQFRNSETDQTTPVSKDYSDYMSLGLCNIEGPNSGLVTGSIAITLTYKEKTGPMLTIHHHERGSWIDVESITLEERINLAKLAGDKK